MSRQASAQFNRSIRISNAWTASAGSFEDEEMMFVLVYNDGVFFTAMNRGDSDLDQMDL